MTTLTQYTTWSSHSFLHLCSHNYHHHYLGILNLESAAASVNVSSVQLGFGPLRGGYSVIPSQERIKENSLTRCR